MSDEQVKEVTTEPLRQTVKVVRRPNDGMVWLYAPHGVALDSDEAWAVAQAMIANHQPEELGKGVSDD